MAFIPSHENSRSGYFRGNVAFSLDGRMAKAYYDRVSLLGLERVFMILTLGGVDAVCQVMHSMTSPSVPLWLLGDEGCTGGS